MEFRRRRRVVPHQITAVYESMLPRQPLRFLLADDPGAGKTIMAGLLIKELIARGDLQRCLVVCPGYVSSSASEPNHCTLTTVTRPSDRMPRTAALAWRSSSFMLCFCSLFIFKIPARPPEESTP